MISIVIPVFNQVEFLADAIESALLQRPQRNRTEIEVICVDDGSTDGSGNVADGYKEIKVIHQVNKGLSSARNTGLMNVEDNDYVLFLDADDILLEGAINKIWDKILETKADIIAPSFKEFGLSQREVILGNPTLEDFKTANRIGYCAAIRRSALLAVGGYSPRMVEGYEDLHLWINLLSKGFTLSTISDILWLYRVRENSMYNKITLEIHKKLIGQINRDFPNVQLSF